jgi:hypothetical protein
MAASQYYKVTAYVGTPHRNAVEVTLPLVGPAGPAGPAGTGLETLTDPGDTLYQGASTGQRLPIGTSGQVLKVVGGFPAWAAESGAVTSVNGRTGSVVVSDFGARPQLLVDDTTINGETDAGFSAPHTAYTLPPPTRFSANQRGLVRVFVSRKLANANITLTLPTSPVNGDIVEIYNLFTLPTYKVIANTSGFGNFDIYPSQRSLFVYTGDTGPPRWVRTYDNNFSTAVPTSITDFSGEIGDMAFDSSYLYVKVPVLIGGTIMTGQWRRVAWTRWT